MICQDRFAGQSGPRRWSVSRADKLRVSRLAGQAFDANQNWRDFHNDGYF